MHRFFHLAACLLSLVYVAYCNPRITDNSPKTDVNPQSGEIEPISDQIDHLIQMEQPEEDKRDWNKLNGVWGKRGWNNLQNVWGKRGWNNLNNMWGKREGTDLPPYWDKRGWNNLSGAWGKRGWNNLSGAWGKRGWNDLSNVWGKRGWNNLSNVWGKRTNDRDDSTKRTTNWNNLKSLWGKRSADWDVSPMMNGIPTEDDIYHGVYIPDLV